MKNIKHIALMLITLVIMSGCTKMLNPAGNSTFSCPDPDNGICGSVVDIYSNRQDIAAYRAEREFKSLPKLDDYIERECGNDLMMGNKDTYDMCVKNAKAKYKEHQNTLHNNVVSSTQFPVPQTGKFMKGVLKAKEGIPLRQPEKISRIWFAPYQNDMGDLVYSHFVYVVEDHSNWLFVPEEKAQKLKNKAVPLSEFTSKVK